jgi:hypothetical protein
MNARVPALTPQPAVNLGLLLCAGYVHDDVLKFDLYGTVEDGEHLVELVTIAGTTHNVTTLLRGRQLLNMGLWLDLRNGVTPMHRELAERHRRQAGHAD